MASSNVSNSLTTFCFITDHDDKRQIVSLGLEFVQEEYHLNLICMDFAVTRILKTKIGLISTAKVAATEHVKIVENPQNFLQAIQDSMTKQKTKLDSLLRAVHFDVSSPRLVGKHKLLAIDKNEASADVEKILTAMVSKISWLEKSAQQLKDGHVETSKTAHLVPIQRLKMSKPRKSYRRSSSFSLINPTMRKVKKEGLSSESD